MAHMECSRNVTQVTVLKSRCEWEDNIKMDLKEMGWEGLDSYGSGQGQVVNVIMYKGVSKSPETGPID
jgi:hypothetical protein